MWPVLHPLVEQVVKYAHGTYAEEDIYNACLLKPAP